MTAPIAIKPIRSLTVPIAAIYSEAHLDKGMTSIPDLATFEAQLAKYNQLVESPPPVRGKVYFSIATPTKLIGMCAIQYGHKFLYDVELARIIKYADAAELCGLYITPEFRGSHVAHQAMNARLEYLQQMPPDIGAFPVIVEFKSVYDAQNLPVARVNHVWETPPTIHFTDDDSMTMTDTTPFIHPDTTRLQQMYENAGFQHIGLNAYESSPVLCLSSLMIPNVLRKQLGAYDAER